MAVSPGPRTGLEPGRRRYRVPDRGTIGYLIMAASVMFALGAVTYARSEADRKIRDASVVNIEKLNQINKAQCESILNLYGVIRKTLRDADARLDTISYYRSHPGEARVQHQQNFATLTKFRNPPCPKDVTVHP